MIFREKSIKRISSPDELNQYVKVVRPSMWVLLVAIMVLLLSILVWGNMGTLDTTEEVTTITKNGVTYFYVTDQDLCQQGMKLKMKKQEGEVVEISTEPKSYDELTAELNDYEQKALNLTDWNYQVVVSMEGITDGIHKMKLITDTVHSIHFILN